MEDDDFHVKMQDFKFQEDTPPDEQITERKMSIFFL